MERMNVTHTKAIAWEAAMQALKSLDLYQHAKLMHYEFERIGTGDNATEVDGTTYPIIYRQDFKLDAKFAYTAQQTFDRNYVVAVVTVSIMAEKDFLSWIPCRVVVSCQDKLVRFKVEGRQAGDLHQWKPNWRVEPRIVGML